MVEEVVEQLARIADERYALPVLVKAGRLPHQHDAGLRVAVARDSLGATLVQGASLAGPDLLVEGLQIFRQAVVEARAGCFLPRPAKSAASGPSSRTMRSSSSSCAGCRSSPDRGRRHSPQSTPSFCRAALVGIGLVVQKIWRKSGSSRWCSSSAV